MHLDLELRSKKCFWCIREYCLANRTCLAPAVRVRPCKILSAVNRHLIRSRRLLSPFRILMVTLYFAALSIPGALDSSNWQVSALAIGEVSSTGTSGRRTSLAVLVNLGRCNFMVFFAKNWCKLTFLGLNSKCPRQFVLLQNDLKWRLWTNIKRKKMQNLLLTATRLNSHPWEFF